MGGTKLTLSVDPDITREAKRWAQRRNTSLSRVVEDMLAALVRAHSPRSVETPITDRLAGCAARATSEADTNPGDPDETAYEGLLARRYLS